MNADPADLRGSSPEEIKVPADPELFSWLPASSLLTNFFGSCASYENTSVIY
jgi:hypothetical protein